MNRLRRGPCLALALAAAAALAGCQSAAKTTIDPSRQELISEFKRVDQAGAKRVTYDQAVAYYQARFVELDRDRNGFIEGDELAAAVPLLYATTPRELLIKLDRNGDGRISREEFAVTANALFQLASKNNELTLKDVETNTPGVASIPSDNRDFGRPAGRR